MLSRALFSLFLFFLSSSSVWAGTNDEGLAFLAKKRAEPGVVETASGLLYKEIRAGSGPSPSFNDPCSCHYSGTLIDGTEFDSSYKRGQPLTFAPNQVIKGWTEALQLMQTGAKWELYINSELGYGDRGAGGAIPGGAVLIFELELLEIKSSQ
jgi:FKBP-type peptidyl-prolyl cis-trans isomerase FklB